MIGRRAYVTHSLQNRGAVPWKFLTVDGNEVSSDDGRIFVLAPTLSAVSDQHVWLRLIQSTSKFALSRYGMVQAQPTRAEVADFIASFSPSVRDSLILGKLRAGPEHEWTKQLPHDQTLTIVVLQGEIQSGWVGLPTEDAWEACERQISRLDASAMG